MRLMKWSLALITVAAIAAPVTAQQRDAANSSLNFPVPVWPANGVVPPELKSHSVFIDVAKNEMVIAYPNNLGSPTFEKDGPGDRNVMRYKLQRDVDPKTRVTVATLNGGRVRYSYAVLNGPAAKQSIDQWTLAIPDGTNSAAKQPTGWYGVVQKSRKMPVPNPDWIKSGAAIVFSYQRADDQIQPGGIKAGFEVESDLRPGFNVGFFRQQPSTESAFQMSGNIPRIVVQNATPPAPPAGAAGAAGGGGGGGFGGGNQAPAGATTAWQPIKDEIDKLLQFEYNSKSVLMIGPKFDKNATDKTVASDFQQGITALTKTGVLAADSAFVKSTLSDLDAYIKAGASGQLKLSGQAKGDAETDLFNAMKVSLHLQ